MGKTNRQSETQISNYNINSFRYFLIYLTQNNDNYPFGPIITDVKSILATNNNITQISISTPGPFQTAWGATLYLTSSEAYLLSRRSSEYAWAFGRN